MIQICVHPVLLEVASKLNIGFQNNSTNDHNPQIDMSQIRSTLKLKSVKIDILASFLPCLLVSLELQMLKIWYLQLGSTNSAVI